MVRHKRSQRRSKMTIIDGFFRKKKKTSGTKCQRCGTQTLGTNVFTKRVEQEGWTVHGLTSKPQPPRGFVGSPSKMVKLENQRRFRCKQCGRVYCMDCLFNYAPPHPNGGKACFKCKGSFVASR